MNQQENQAVVEPIPAAPDPAPSITASMGIMAAANGAALFLPQTMAEAMKFAEIMSKTDLALPDFLRGKPGTCMAISMQAYRWGMDPFAVASKCYSVHSRLAYESQLIMAVVNTRAPLQRRLTVEYSGEEGTRKCTVTGQFKGEEESRSASSPPLNAITPKNSPLWESDPDQQLFYYTARVWARRYVPELLMGVYSPDEFEPRPDPAQARNITPKPPTREDFADDNGVIDPPATDGNDSARDPWPFFTIDKDGVERGWLENEGYADVLLGLLSNASNSATLEGIWDSNLPEINRFRDIDPDGVEFMTEEFMKLRGTLLNALRKDQNADLNDDTSF